MQRRLQRLSLSPSLTPHLTHLSSILVFSVSNYFTLSDTKNSHPSFILVSDGDGEAEEGEGNTANIINLH